MTVEPAPEACLVLDARRTRLRIGLLGRAVHVLGEGMAPVLHPIARLHRVAILGDAVLDSAVVRALADAAKPVGWLDGDGRLRAVLLPLGRRRTTVAEALDRLAERPDWAGRLEDWRLARLSRLARTFVPDPAGAARVGWSGAEALLCAAVPASRARRARLAAEARSHALLVALAGLGTAGVPGRWMGTAGDPMRNLVPLFGQIALWHLVRRIVRSPRLRSSLAHAYASDGRAGAPGAGPATAALLTSAEGPLRQTLIGEFRMFHAWLLDLTAAGSGLEPEGLPWVG